MTIDKQEIKALVDRVKTDRRFCADENHHVLADGVLALLAEIESAETRLHDVAVLCATVEQERDQLKAENEALRKSAGLAAILPQLDEALEDLELHGRHTDQGYRKLKDWYRKVKLACDSIDAAMAKEASHD